MTVLLCAFGMLAMPAGGVGPQESVKLEVPLHYVEFKDAQEALRFGGAGSGSYLQPVPGQKTPKTPADMVGAVVRRLNLEGMRKPVWVAISLGAASKSPAGARVYRGRRYTDLCLDLDQNGTFEPSERFKAKVTAAANLFGPMQLPGYDGDPPRTVYAVCRYGSECSFVTAGYYGGEADLEGKTVKLGVVDLNANGVWGERSNEMVPGDALLIDFNGNGRFDVAENEMYGMGVPGELVPNSFWVQMPDRQFYHIRVKDDMSAMTLERSVEPVGQLSLKAPKMAVMLYGPDGLLAIHAQQPPVSLPAGTYNAYQYVLLAPDASGKDWAVAVSRSDRGRLRIRPDKTTELTMGPPIKMTLSQSHYLSEYSVSLPLVDAYENSVSGLTKPDGTQPTPPKLTIVDAAGKVVFSQNFQYG